MNNFYSQVWGKFSGPFLGTILLKVLNSKEARKGPASIFSPRGKVALMFLKQYAGCSDRRLMEQSNDNVHYQISSAMPPVMKVRFVTRGLRNYYGKV